jgi:RimJ/RimL family protein N-acetyltransferase
VAFTAVGNLKSRAVMQKLGMRNAGEFAHPRLPAGHALRAHCLYRLARAEWVGLT